MGGDSHALQRREPGPLCETLCPGALVSDSSGHGLPFHFYLFLSSMPAMKNGNTSGFFLSLFPSDLQSKAKIESPNANS